MPIALYFKPAAMTFAQYQEVIRRLEEAGSGSPAGRTFHVCFGDQDQAQVMDIWDSMESFHAFGAILMPIMGEVGIEPGEPMIQPVMNIVEG